MTLEPVQESTRSNSTMLKQFWNAMRLAVQQGRTHHFTLHVDSTLVANFSTCVAGWSGTNCEVNVDDCVNMPCKNGGTCVDGLNSYSCSCGCEWSGPTCETKRSVCAELAPCLNSAECVTDSTSFHCQCAPGFFGPTCALQSLGASGLQVVLLGLTKYMEVMMWQFQCEWINDEGILMDMKNEAYRAAILCSNTNMVKNLSDKSGWVLKLEKDEAEWYMFLVLELW